MTAKGEKQLFSNNIYIKSICLITIILLIFGFLPGYNADAYSIAIYENNAAKIYSTDNTYSLCINGSDIDLEIYPFEYENETMIPLRAVFEGLGGNVSWEAATRSILVELKDNCIEFKSQKKLCSIDGIDVEMNVPVINADGTSMIPLSLLEHLKYINVKKDDTGSIIDIKLERLNGNIEGIEYISYYVANGYEQVLINSKLYENSNVFYLSNPARVVIDIPGAVKDAGEDAIAAGGKIIEKIRYARFNEDTVRVVLDLNYESLYDVKNSDGDITICFFDGQNVLAEQESLIVPSYHENNVKGYFEIIDAEISLKSKGYKCYYNSSGNILTVEFDNKKGILKEGEYDVDSELLDKIVIEDYSDQNRTKIMFYSKKPDFYLSFNNATVPGSGSTVIIAEKRIFEPVAAVKKDYKMNGVLSYSVTGDRACITLDKIRLTTGEDENMAKYYYSSVDSTGTNIVITFKNSVGYVPPGNIEIDDMYIKSISVIRNLQSGMTSISIKAKKKLNFVVMGRKMLEVNDTAITFIEPAENGEKIVVLDAGHGGRDPGAVEGSIYEKDLNLDIVLRLEALLEEKGIKTYLIRKDDSYIGLYERAYIANGLNAALFLSVHNNAMLNRSYGGTMTLCYSTDRGGSEITGMDFADNIQNSMAQKLDTKDRGVFARPNLVVLKATIMPAALAEVAFMTNENDISKLKTPKFRQKAAEALCSAVMETLKK